MPTRSRVLTRGDWVRVMGLVLTAMIISIGFAMQVRASLVRIDTVLTGAAGNYGLVGSVHEVQIQQGVMQRQLDVIDTKLDQHLGRKPDGS